MFFFFFKQKTAYEMRISDWSSDVCSSDLHFGGSACDKSMDLCRVRFGMAGNQRCLVRHRFEGVGGVPDERAARFMPRGHLGAHMLYGLEAADKATELFALASIIDSLRSEEHTSELQSLMRISYAVFC